MSSVPPKSTSAGSSLKGRVAIITGSSRGIGRGIALELGRRGASIVVNYTTSQTAADEVVQELQQLGTSATAVQADELFTKAIATFKRVDIVVSNSGIESFDRSEDLTPKKFDHVFSINAKAQFFVATTAYKYLPRYTDHGRVIMMSSIAARVMGVEDHALYAGSKSAVEGFSNAIAPGGVKSDMFATAAINYIPGADSTWSAERIEGAMAGACPLGRVAVPRDIGRVVAWLAGDDSEWITGQVILCAGGSSV